MKGEAMTSTRDSQPQREPGTVTHRDLMPADLCPSMMMKQIATQSLDEWTLVGFAQLDVIGDPSGGALYGTTLAAACSRTSFMESCSRVTRMDW